MGILEEGTLVVRPVLGLTAYLSHPELWAREGASRALDAVLEILPADRLTTFTTSTLTTWRPLQIPAGARIRDALSSWTLVSDRPRHLFSLRLADVANVPQFGFSYTEIDPARASRSAVLEVSLPFTAPPAHLETLARKLVAIGPLHGLVGGFAVRWNVLHQRLAFDQVYLWARRFLGLDVQEAEVFAWTAPRALPGVSWLNWVPEPLLAGLSDRERPTLPPEVVVDRVPGGALIVAGPAPVLGDLNRMEFPRAYAAAAALLEPLFPPEPPRFWGGFHPGDATARWYRRLLDPEAWLRD